MDTKYIATADYFFSRPYLSNGWACGRAKSCRLSIRPSSSVVCNRCIVAKR